MLIDGTITKTNFQLQFTGSNSNLAVAIEEWSHKSLPEYMLETWAIIRESLMTIGDAEMEGTVATEIPPECYESTLLITIEELFKNTYPAVSFNEVEASIFSLPGDTLALVIDSKFMVPYHSLPNYHSQSSNVTVDNTNSFLVTDVHSWKVELPDSPETIASLPIAITSVI